MPINYVPNDPRAGQPPAVIIDPHDDRPAGRADFDYEGEVPEDLYVAGTDEFLFWQCREAALRAVDLWEEIDGQPLNAWQSGGNLRLIQRVPNDNRLNAFYDRSSLSFFRLDQAGESFQSGASADVVAHEAGHAFLDTIRPDLWNNFFGEQGAFHEAFGDCIAIMTALEDGATRDALVAGNLLRQTNFVETTAEDLSHGISLVNPNHNAATPRTAFNNHDWALPSSLPVDGGPGVLINEVHSFGMVFTGCFYDTLTNIYEAGADQSEAGLLAASRTAGRILAAGARAAPLQARFFESVGNAMVLADQNLHAGFNAHAIRDAFERHNITLNAQQMLAPTNVLAGRPPSAKVSGVRDVITRASRRDLVSMVGPAVQQRFYAAEYELGSESVAAVRHQHKVPLGDVSEKLDGVICLVEEDVLIGASEGRAAALGAVPSASTSVAEVQNFVYSLDRSGQIETADKSRHGTTHAVRKVGDDMRLVRMRYACSCGCQRAAPRCTAALR